MTTCRAETDSLADTGQRAEKPLLDANRRLDEVLATLGHEIRNPLSALSHALEVWRRSQDDPLLTEELRNIMERQVRQLTLLSDELLDAVRISNGKLELRREQVRLGQLIDGACEEVRPLIDRCGHALTVRRPSDAVTVYGDASRLLQVFANLIQNAAKFTGRNGSLSVAAESEEDKVVVRIRDNGPGIEEHMLQAIFEGFTQVNGTRTPANDGLGIGLRLVKSIVELHGGSVAAHSQGLGCGSEFTVRLPVLGNAVHSKQNADAQPSAGHHHNGQQLPGYRIVVVDDDRSLGELLAQLLSAIGQSVTVAHDGAMAVRTVLEERPQVVFLDLVMQGIDGYEVARQLRQYRELAGLVLIALSGYSNQENQRRARIAGFDKYLVKPVSVARLAETLAAIAPAPSGACES